MIINEHKIEEAKSNRKYSVSCRDYEFELFTTSLKAKGIPFTYHEAKYLGDDNKIRIEVEFDDPRGVHIWEDLF